MSLELPALSAVVARLAEPEINLAAYGGVVFPLALIIESPILMLLPASTALSKDLPSYRLGYRFMMISGAALTLLHVLIAFTPLYYLVVEGILGVPPEIVEPARIGLMIMLPWTWAIAYRRYHQGVLIRFNRSGAVGTGTVVRLVSNLAVLVIGFWLGNIPGIVVASSAVALGVTLEAIFVGFIVRPVLRGELPLAELVEPPLTYQAFLTFYIPLVMTSLLVLLANPIGSAALSRMPRPIESLAVWPVITGLVFIFRSAGIAFNEVVVAVLDQPNSSSGLKKFTLFLSLATTFTLLLITATPLSWWWFSVVSALPANLAVLAQRALWLALPLPLMSVLQSWYQGVLLYGRRTRSITESVILYLITSAIVLVGGVLWGQVTGLYVGLIALTSSVIVQTAWLGWRSWPTQAKIAERDSSGTFQAALLP